MATLGKWKLGKHQLGKAIFRVARPVAITFTPRNLIIKLTKRAIEE